MTLVGVHHLRFLGFNVTSKKRVDNHVIKNLGLLQYGELRTSKLNHEARDVFWTKNDFRVDWEELGGFSLGFRVLSQSPALYLVPHERNRVSGLTLIFPDLTTMASIIRVLGLKIPNHSLRQLLDVPALQKIEIVVRILLMEERDCLTIFQIKQVKKIES